ncbi:MAG: lipopolysaccharide transport periplasmic protein LptA [Rhodobacterales bacterium]|nr:lipopolysaccharide transport periplasmic protein LptA [Rhodobacterales bacterium]
MLLTVQPATAQGALVAFGDVKQDTDQPVEVEADSLAINQEDGTAIFTGNVVIAQGEMRLSAAKVQVYYHGETKKIERLHATGGVTVVSGDDAAEGQEADYNISTGNIVMNGDVLLVQGQNVLSAAHMTINTKTGTAQMDGRVKTILNTGN